MFGSNEGSVSSPSSEDRAAAAVESFGWVYHMGVNSIGREYCHLRFLYLKRKYIMMYKRDPHDNPSIKPIRKGVVSNTLMVEELGRRKVNHGDVYVLRFYNRLDDTKKGEIACATAAEARKWMEAFDQAKQQAAYDLWRGSGRAKINVENELNLEGHRPRLRPYTADGLKKLVRIGKGPEKLLRQSSYLGSKARSVEHSEGDVVDANEAHEWKCILVNGIRIFEDLASAKTGKGLLMKSIAVVDANLDIVFDVVCDLDQHQRYQWDMLTSDLELVDSLDGHYDVIYGTYDPKYQTRT